MHSALQYQHQTPFRLKLIVCFLKIYFSTSLRLQNVKGNGSLIE